MKGKLITAVLICFSSIKLLAQDIIVRNKYDSGYFPIVSVLHATSIYVDLKDHWLVHRSAQLLQQDIQMQTGFKPEIISSLPLSADNIIIIGSLDSSEIINRLSSEKKINSETLKGKWESFQFQTLKKPTGGINNALIISGSDRRGTAFGVFELSRQMGVSPWYWWADVPVKKKKEIYFKNGIFIYGPPSVKYRGIFINDEAPAFSGWTKEKFGGVNHLVYEKIFELMLRMKANYLWPAMWGNAFNDDDSLNPILADKYGIVMGTTHHEPMLRAQQEWKRYGHGQWNYDSNEIVLKAFWKKGIEHMDSRESIVSIGMRGDGDMPMTEGSNIALLERIVHDQRKIIEEVTHKPASATPQLWALYKEVQDYYDKDMTVPDDVTLLLCDDNWGNVRKLPRLTDKPRTGGYGIYYHFDYVGDPRNYKWLNTNSIPRVWEQMNLAYQYGADRIWIVNVGDIKPMEFPIQFFLDFAWDTKKWNAENISGYSEEWAKEIFGSQYASDIGALMSSYTKFNSRRKPELLSPDTYSLVNYREAEMIEEEYGQLAAKAEEIYNQISDPYKNAFYQLVLYPIKACANLNNLYVAAGKNRIYAAQRRASTNDFADSVKKYFAEDAALAKYYNTVMSDGKWDHMMDQTHIGYTYWQQPEKNGMPKVEYIQLPDSAKMGLSIEGSSSWWPDDTSEAILPEFDSFGEQSYYIDLFNQGRIPFEYNIKSTVPWIKLSEQKNKIEKQQRLWIKVDWEEVPIGTHKIPLTISGSDGRRLTVFAIIKNYGTVPFKGFVERNGYVSMEASHFTKAINKPDVRWQLIPGIGRTGSGMTVTPVTAPMQTPGADGPRLEYKMMLFDTGRIQVQLYFSPTLNFNGTELHYAISFDDELPQIFNLHPDNSNKSWQQWVANNIIIDSAAFHISKTGIHILKYWMVDPGLVLQKIVVDLNGVKPSYLGPPETLVK
ncbi:MAG TPA: glycosyl hydrolase 115 family protein [Puia sp.]|nr:glycosyl hydrolase 115 family protein [Puia sp.]